MNETFGYDKMIQQGAIFKCLFNKEGDGGEATHSFRFVLFLTCLYVVCAFTH